MNLVPWPGISQNLCPALEGRFLTTRSLGSLQSYRRHCFLTVSRKQCYFGSLSISKIVVLKSLSNISIVWSFSRIVLINFCPQVWPYLSESLHALWFCCYWCKWTFESEITWNQILSFPEFVNLFIYFKKLIVADVSVLEISLRQTLQIFLESPLPWACAVTIYFSLYLWLLWVVCF